MGKNKGKVYLIGAGPGDIGLLTVKGLKCLKKADVVIYDFHLNAQVLNYINHDAEFIYAGKRGGHHTMTQDEINDVIVEKAGAGRIVCRLKGGDPFVFGRGGEEAEVIEAEGIPFEVIPGISSAIAAPAYAGIPLTHRKYSSTFAVIPGYEDTTKTGSAVDWSKLATGVGTLVFLMAVKNINEVAEKLIRNGRPKDTPVAVIRWGTRPEQVTLTGTLENIAELVESRHIRPPAVMVVGEVVRLRDKLKWYEKKPLFGQRVLVTREHSGGFERLEELGAEVMQFPTIRVVPVKDSSFVDKCIQEVETYDWIVLTSANGVGYFFDRLIKLERDIRDLKGIKICAVGEKTAEAVLKYGIRVDMIPESFRAEGLVKSFSDYYSERRQGLKDIRILLPRAEKAREVFPEKMRESGVHIDTPSLYRAVKPGVHGKRTMRFFKERKITIATFTSAATFHNFCDIMGGEALDYLRDVAIAVIGDVTGKAVEEKGLEVHIMPEKATVDEMVQAIIRWVSRQAHVSE
ncbi:uroporphyrinogen-III C-methyltransferase [bacterium BMS3Abin07]|nr:uroporphyrinogen-III C-methyltransferase [bacterium BMS3Abin07]GBE32415.1 uroporphyrinogen-III C-methyltransferase [bacterium BMS3Bbin05]HDL20830.1 uroporphyrinogen-III C-methyltransferase [Nitrospirota bacterium]HDO23354.1 uroporphyrinogen-III C-methyltransferase [Nitrospirota bacterium]HDZ88999.1 uroporphyrinogen-III C-methyltransferase [Nitrospirota bacterium]